MNISLPEALKDFVESRLNDGGYGTASEYVRELIRMTRRALHKSASNGFCWKVLSQAIRLR
ncbi:MAG: type II toxin-antitoxin system ParD family antitoxin [Verrucomicrobiales bacterium]